MAAPVGLTPTAVVDAAVDELEAQGRIDAVGLRPVADRLGVRVQSLYAHVDGADGLRRALALRGLDALADRLTEAAIGRAGPDAVGAIVRAYLDFAALHPGLYDATLRPPGDDPEIGVAMAAVTRPLDLVLASFGFDETDAIHWYRIIFSTVHGFSVLRRDGTLTLDADPDETAARIEAMFARELELARQTTRPRKAAAKARTPSAATPRAGRRSPRR
jgi:AcrR family transcriptional regulator